MFGIDWTWNTPRQIDILAKCVNKTTMEIKTKMDKKSETFANSAKAPHMKQLVKGI